MRPPHASRSAPPHRLRAPFLRRERGAILNCSSPSGQVWGEVATLSSLPDDSSLTDPSGPVRLSDAVRRKALAAAPSAKAVRSQRTAIAVAAWRRGGTNWRLTPGTAEGPRKRRVRRASAAAYSRSRGILKRDISCFRPCDDGPQSLRKGTEADRHRSRIN